LEVLEKQCTFNDIQIFTKVYNYNEKNDEAILFLHGLGGNNENGAFLFDINNKYMTICTDLLNHGKSGVVSNFTWDTYVESIRAVVIEYKLKKIHLVGHSLGADIVMMYSLKYPSEVQNIILLDRAYYNYSELEKYNFTIDFYKFIEYNINLDKDIFDAIIEMLYYNDISKTWGIKKDVLLIASNPYWPKDLNPSIVDIIKMAKISPDEFDISHEKAKNLPDITKKNLYDYMDFLETKINEFEYKNKKFKVVKTSYEHAMLNNESYKPQIFKLIIDFIN